MTASDVFATVVGLVGVFVYLGIGSLAGLSSGGMLGAIRGEDGKLSASKFQFFLWTGVVVFSYLALWTARATACWGKGAPSMPELPTNVLLAMGFSVITLATAKGVTTAYVTGGRIAKGRSASVHLSDLVTQDDGSPDLSKIQMLTWTVVAAVTFLYSVGSAYGAFDAGCTSGGDFPDIGTSLMALMGIGQGAYLGTKIVTSSTVVPTSLSPSQAAAGATITINGTGFGKVRGSVLFGQAAASLASGDSAWTDTKVLAIAPQINPATNQAFQPGDTVSVELLLTGGSGQTGTGSGLPFTYTAAPLSLPRVDRATAGASQWSGFSGTVRKVGSSPSGNVTVFIDDALEAAEQNAKDLIVVADQIVTSNNKVFGTQGAPVNVLIWAINGKTDGSEGGAHDGCDYEAGGNIQICACLENSKVVATLFEMELSECSMGGNLCGVSTGEALSRWCSAFVVGSWLREFITAPKWVAAGMQDFVNTTLAVDWNDASIGCGMAFISWMLKQGYELRAIAPVMVSVGDQGTLADIYTRLTSDARENAWPKFQAAVSALPGGVINDDPFGGNPPLPTLVLTA